MNTESRRSRGRAAGGGTRRRRAVDPRAPVARLATGETALRGVSLRPARAGVVRIRLVRVLRLVPGAHQAGAQGQRRQPRADSTRHTLLQVLEALLRLHPLMPFITEDLWQRVAPRLSIDADAFRCQAYPGRRCRRRRPRRDRRRMVEGDGVRAAPHAQRTRRVARQAGDACCCKTAPKRPHAGQRASTRSCVPPQRIERIEWIDGDAPAAAADLVGELELFVPLEGLVDLGAERTRLDKELKRVEGELAKSALAASETFVGTRRPRSWNRNASAWSTGPLRDALAAQRARLADQRPVVFTDPSACTPSASTTSSRATGERHRVRETSLIDVLAAGTVCFQQAAAARRCWCGLR